MIEDINKLLLKIKNYIIEKGENMENMKIKAQKLWMDHRHHIIIFVVGVVIGAVIF
jgi:hypothetical protein